MEPEMKKQLALTRALEAHGVAFLCEYVLNEVQASDEIKKKFSNVLAKAAKNRDRYLRQAGYKSWRKMYYDLLRETP